MAGSLTIECGIAGIGDIMLCAYCERVTTLFRERCLTCGHSSVFTIAEALNGGVDLSKLIGDADAWWIVRVVNELMETTSTPDAVRPAA